jgi:AcrR family transcriptional regulator
MNPSIAEGSNSARERILESAGPIFAQRGFTGTSVAEIAAEADISKSTVFHHFANKRALYLAVIEQAAADFAQTLESVLERPGSLEGRLEAFQDKHLAHIMEKASITQLVLRELQKPNSTEARHLVQDVLFQNFQRLVGFIAGAQQAGLIRAAANASVTAMTLISANVFYFQHQHVLPYLPGFEETQAPRQYTKAVIDLIFHGLRKDPNS